MAFVRSFVGYKPPARYDGEPFTSVNIREAATADGVYSTIATVELDPVDAVPAAPQARSFTTGDAVLAFGWYILQWEDDDGATIDSDPIAYGDAGNEGPAGGLLTVDEYKLAEGIDLADNSRDDQIEQAVAQVTQAVRRVTDRDFGSEVVTTSRSFPYHGGGIVSIDDCSTITSVTLDGRPLAYDTDYRPEPWNEPVFFYLDLYTEPVTSRNREMDFAINLNTTRTNPNRPPQVVVEASFGWPIIPDDIKLAAIEMVRVSVKSAADELTSESIAEYSYTNVAEYSPGARWPSRAMDILATYRRPNM